MAGGPLNTSIGIVGGLTRIDFASLFALFCSLLLLYVLSLSLADHQPSTIINNNNNNIDSSSSSSSIIPTSPFSSSWFSFSLFLCIASLFFFLGTLLGGRIFSSVRQLLLTKIGVGSGGDKGGNNDSDNYYKWRRFVFVLASILLIQSLLFYSFHQSNKSSSDIITKELAFKIMDRNRKILDKLNADNKKNNGQNNNPNIDTINHDATAIEINGNIINHLVNSIDKKQDNGHRIVDSPLEITKDPLADLDMNQIPTNPTNNNGYQTISVVLPCANEGEYSVKTTRSFFQNTPDHVLKEVIVVDDGSTPPLKTIFPADLLDNDKYRHRIKFVRHEKFTGLINAKLQGGNAATGDIVAFFDCHVRPRVDWEKSILQLINENRLRVVVPSITTLNIKTWDEDNYGDQGFAKCYLTLDGDFAWVGGDSTPTSSSYNEMEIPIMSGGLLALSRYWWRLSGGYDPLMVGWGGENIDQSVRTWLCGGEIVHARPSKVAHMWRLQGQAETRARYTVPEGSVTKNVYRAMAVWADEWKIKLRTNPRYRFNPIEEANITASLSTLQSVKDRLKCKHFSYFFHRFRHYYIDGGIIAQKVYRLRHIRSDLCLHSFSGLTPAPLTAVPCSEHDEWQYWHRGNRRLDNRKCCSGIRLWNSKLCVTGTHIQDGGIVETQDCSIISEREDQWFEQLELNPSEHPSRGLVQMTRHSKYCLAIQSPIKPVLAQQCEHTQSLLTEEDKIFSQSFEIHQIDDKHSKLIEASTGYCLGEPVDPIQANANPAYINSVMANFNKIPSESLAFTPCHENHPLHSFVLPAITAEFHLPYRTRLENAEGNCLEVVTKKEGGGQLIFNKCDHDKTTGSQWFTIQRQSDQNMYRLEVDETDLCISSPHSDASVTIANALSAAKAASSSALAVPSNNNNIALKFSICVTARDTKNPVLPPQAGGPVERDVKRRMKRGQLFELIKLSKQIPGIPNDAFLLKDPILQLCIASDGPDKIAVRACPEEKELLTTVEGQENSKYFWLPHTERKLQNLKERRCLDAADHITPILYYCYPQKNSNQEWSYTAGYLQNDQTTTCIDFLPRKDAKVVLAENCQQPEKKNTVEWEWAESFEPIEYTYYRESMDKYSWFKDN